MAELPLLRVWPYSRGRVVHQSRGIRLHAGPGNKSYPPLADALLPCHYLPLPYAVLALAYSHTVTDLDVSFAFRKWVYLVGLESSGQSWYKYRLIHTPVDGPGTLFVKARHKQWRVCTKQPQGLISSVLTDLDWQDTLL